MVSVGVVFIFVVSATVTFCIDALSVWYGRGFRIVVSGCVRLMGRRGCCVYFMLGALVCGSCVVIDLHLSAERC